MAKKNEKIALKESASFETAKVTKTKVPLRESIAQLWALDPTVQAHLAPLQEEAKRTKSEQRKVLSSGMHDEGIGERVLIVSKNGDHKVVFEKEAK